MRARVLGEPWAAIRKDADGQWIWSRGEIEVGHPLDFAIAGAEVEIDYGRFTLFVWRDDRVHYRALVHGVLGEASTDEELALWSALDRVGDDRAPPACFYCKWSDVEASTGWGNFGCFVAIADAYERYVAEHRDARLKWVTNLGPRWVEPFDTCERFQIRPRGFGYRGRP